MGKRVPQWDLLDGRLDLLDQGVKRLLGVGAAIDVL
jgi:hypothetical protein